MADRDGGAGQAGVRETGGGAVDQTAGMPRGRTGIRELARHLGVSIGTVSRALNGRADVNPETKRRVLEAARRLSYVPNHLGRSLRTGATGTLGVLWRIADSRGSYGEPFFVGLFGGIQERLRAADCDLAVFVSREEDERHQLRRVVDRGMVDALILPWTRTHDPRLDDVAERGFPFVALGRSQSGGAHDWIDLDFEQAGREATLRLVRQGHARIGIGVAGRDLMQGRFFLAGYRAVLAEAGLPFDPALVGEDDITEGGGHRVTGRLLAARPTAILLINEQMALGAYRRLGEAGLQAGRDVAVIGGVMDSPLCGLIQPGLTCFGLQPFDLGGRLAEIALERLERRPDRPLRQELWPLRLIERGSDPHPIPVQARNGGKHQGRLLPTKRPVPRR